MIIGHVEICYAVQLTLQMLGTGRKVVAVVPCNSSNSYSRINNRMEHRRPVVQPRPVSAKLIATHRPNLYPLML